MKTKHVVKYFLIVWFFLGSGLTMAADKISIKAGTTMHEVLSDFTGKRVALRLDSGEEVEGTIAMVGNSLVHLSKLAGMEFFDAVIAIDSISGVRVRTVSN